MNTVLKMLCESEYVSGESISARLGITRAAVWKKITALRESGWEIESAGKRGYRLIPGDRLEPVLWEEKLISARYGHGINRFEETVDSTNTQVKQMAVAGAPDGSLCLCECQTAGKGRLGRRWNSPAGQGLYVSVMLRPALSPAQAPLITLCAAMAMNQAVRETCGIDSGIKWPNDLVYQGKKLCGILLEISADPDRIEYVVIGTGLNIRKGAYPPELAHQAASLEEFTEAPFRRDILVHYLAALEGLIQRLEKDGFSAFEEDYRRHSCTLGHKVHVSGAVDLTGTAEAIDESGALMVRTEDGQLHRVLSGDVSVRGLMGYV